MIPSGPEWIVTWPDIGGAIGALIIIGAAVWAVRRFVHPIMVRISLVTDLILGRPAQQGIPGQPSMVERIDAVASDVTEIRAGLAEVKAEVKPNHGGSAHDKLSSEIGEVRAEAQAATASVTRLTQVLTQQYGIHLDTPDSGTPGV